MSHTHDPEPAPNAGARALRAITIEHAAEETGLSMRTIVSFRGGTQPSEASAAKLSKALGIPREAWRQPAARYAEPVWLCEVLEALAWHPAARTTLERALIAKSGDAARLAEFDEIMGWGNGEPYVALMGAAYGAEIALQEHIDRDGNSMPVTQPRPQIPAPPDSAAA